MKGASATDYTVMYTVCLVRNVYHRQDWGFFSTRAGVVDCRSTGNGRVIVRIDLNGVTSEREKENVPTWAPSKSPGPRTSLSRFLVRFGFVAALPDVGGLQALSTECEH